MSIKKKNTKKKISKIEAKIDNPVIVDTKVKTIKKTKPLVQAVKQEMVTPKPEKFIPRLLCFSNIDPELVCPYHFIQNIIEQSYKNIYYILNIFVLSKEEEIKYKKILKNLISTNVKINFFFKDLDNIDNQLIGFSSPDYKNYNTFLYINARGLYLSDYIKTIIDSYNHNTDIIFIKFHDNKNINSYILNNKAIDILIKNKYHTYNDNWSAAISEHSLTNKEVYSDYCFILNTPDKISSKNTEATHQLIENDFFVLCVFEHHYWSSFVYLNKRNHRMYNISNDDHGSFEIQDNNSIQISWDTWGGETFYKKYDGDNIYYYSINE